jgi:hypothetical protein
MSQPEKIENNGFSVTYNDGDFKKASTSLSQEAHNQPIQSGEKTNAPATERKDVNNSDADKASLIQRDATIPHTEHSVHNNANILNDRVKALNGTPVSATYRTNDGQISTALETYNPKSKQIEVLMNNQRYERVAEQDSAGRQNYSLRPLNEQGKPTGGESIGLAAMRTGMPPEGVAPEKFLPAPAAPQRQDASPNHAEKYQSTDAASTQRSSESNQSKEQTKNQTVDATKPQSADSSRMPSTELGKLQNGDNPATFRSIDTTKQINTAGQTELISAARKKDSVHEVDSVNRTPAKEASHHEQNKIGENPSTSKFSQTGAPFERTIPDSNLQAKSLEQIKRDAPEKHDAAEKHVGQNERSAEHTAKSFSEIKDSHEQKNLKQLDSNDAAKHNSPILDAIGRQINVAPRKDIIDKISGPIQNSLSIKDGAQFIVAAAAKFVDGLKPGRAPEASMNDRDIKIAKPSDVKAAKLEDITKIARKLPEDFKDSVIKVCDKLVKNPNEKFEGKDKQLADILRPIKNADLVKQILTNKVPPDFSKIPEKHLTQFLAVLTALIDCNKASRTDRPQGSAAKSDMPSANAKPIVSIAADKVPSANMRKPGDSNRMISTTKPGDPRAYIDSKLLLLQNLGILKPFSDLIAKFKGTKSDTTYSGTSTRSAHDKSINTTPAGSRPAGDKSSDTKTVSSKVSGDKSAGTKSTDGKIIGDKSADTRTIGGKIIGDRLADNKPVGDKIAGVKPQLPASSKPLVETQKDTSTKMIAQQKPSEKAFSPSEWISQQKTTSNQQKELTIQQKDSKTRVSLDKPNETSTKIIAQLKPAETQNTTKNLLSTDAESKTRQISISENHASAAKKDTKNGSDVDAPNVLSKEAAGADSEEQENTVEIDPALILEQTFKSKPESKGSEIEERIKEKRNRDKYRQRTRVIRTVERGDTLKSISMGFFGEEASAPIVYHYNQKHVECINYNGKILAVPIIGRKIVMPELDEIEAYHKEKISYDHIEFGSALTLEMMAARDKAEKEVQSEIQDRNSEAIDPALLVNYRASLREWLNETKTVKALEQQYYSKQHEWGVRIALQLLDDGAWVETCCYEIYSALAIRIQYYKRGGSKKSPCSLPPAKIKEMAKTDFRNNWERICDDYRA